MERRRGSSSEHHGKSMLRGRKEEQKPMGDTERILKAWDENQSGLPLSGKFRLISMRLKSQEKKCFGYCTKKFIGMLP